MDVEMLPPNFTPDPSDSDADLDALVAATLTGDLEDQAVESYHRNLIAAGFVPAI